MLVVWPRCPPTCPPASQREARSRPYRQVMSLRHILFSLILHPCVHPAPSERACCLPADLPVAWHSLTVLRLSSLSACLVSLSTWVGGGCQGYKPGLSPPGGGWSRRVEPRAAEAWNLLLGNHRPGEGSPAGQGGQGGRCRPGGKAAFLLTKPMC